MKKLTAIIVAAAMLGTAGGVLAEETQKTFEQKIVEMQELGIIDKEDDLKLTETLTRAQATKLICSVKGLRGEVTQTEAIYSDVTDFHWAYPYVILATASGIIDGYEDGTFRPENEVTAQEFVKMLVSAVGYSVYAEHLGGYPNGYMGYGSSLQITKDISLSNNDAITREVAFNLLYNALDAPLLVVDGYNFADGVATPTYKVLDGENFCSLRTELTD